MSGTILNTSLAHMSHNNPVSSVHFVDEETNGGTEKLSILFKAA